MQATERPVFRQDLVAEVVDEQGARYIDVADPDSGNMFRFFEVEYALACAMDGQRDVAGIVKWAQEELGLTPSPKEVQTVIATLADLRFIETGATRLSDVPEAKAAAKNVHEEATTAGAAAYSDDELGRGVVVGKQQGGVAAASGMNVELGNAGATGARAAEPALPKADFDLGAPGAGATAGSKKPAAPTEDFALGAPGAASAKADKKPAAADLSLDLTADMPVKAADVKEAVRQSKVMTAVEVPKELQDELEAPAQSAKAAAEKAAAEKKAAEEKAAAEKKAAEKAAADKKAAEKKPADKAADKKAADKAADKKTDKAADKAAEKKPITLPKTAPEKTPVAPPAPKQGISPVLVVLLILAVVGAGAYFFWKLVLDKPDASEQSKAQPPKPPPPPPPPAEVTAKVTLETPPAQEIKAPAGTIESIEPADKEVKGGDVIATLVGAKALNTELDKLRADIDKGTPAIEAATKDLSDAQQKENNEAGVKAAQAKLDRVKKPIEDKKATVVKKQADLDKLIVKTTIDGKLALPDPAPKAGDKVTADQIIATVQKPTVPVATFKIPAGTKVGADGNVTINAGGKTVVCTVSDAQAETIKVTCPPDSGLADGTDVKFTLPK